MVKCINMECDNYKQELEEHIHICPICGKETERKQTELDGKRKLGPIVSIGSIAAILFTFFLFDFIDFYIAFFMGVGIIVACIVAAFISKVKGSIITTIVAAAGFIGIFAYYGLFG